VFEFNRPVCAANLRHEGCAMSGFYVRPSSKVGSEHRKIVRDDRIKLVISPRFSDLFFISHLTCPNLSGKVF